MLVNWIANGANNEFVDLKWDLPLDVSDIVIYNIKPNPANNTNIQVTDCELFLYLNGIETKHVNSTGIISGNGTKITLTGLPKADELKVIVKSFTGQITGQSVAGLAEVETIARISFYEVNGVKQISSTIPGRFSLSQNYPNPFNPATIIKFDIPAVGQRHALDVNMKVYDILGREVAVLINKQLLPGSYEVNWNAANFPSGVYFYRLEAEGFSESKKMVLIK